MDLRGKMSRYSLHSVHIADGFTNDCDDIVQRCLQHKELDFQTFSKIWKEMNFSLLYRGRTSDAEIAELSEELIYIAKHYMIKDTSYFEENVTGLYLVYSLLNLQPFTDFACLRLVPEDVTSINRIELVARRERRLDVLFILGEVLIKWTQYHVVERPRGMEKVIRKYLEGYSTVDKLGVRPMGVFYRQNEELDHIRDLSSVTRQYILAKKSLFGDSPGDPTLQYINENLGTELNASLRKLVTGSIERSDHETNDEDSLSEDLGQVADDRSKTLSAIKHKAMSNAVDPMKHLVSIDKRKQSKNSPGSKSDLKEPTGKIKTNKHVKPVTVSPPKKQTVRRKCKRKSKGDLTGDDIAYEDLNLEEFQQVSHDKSDDRDNDEASEQGDLEIRSLPFIFGANSLRDIEIEVIDQTNGQKITQVTEDTSDLSNKIINTTKINSAYENYEIIIIDQMKDTNEGNSICKNRDDGTEIEIIDQTKTDCTENKPDLSITNTTALNSSNENDEIVIIDQVKDPNQGNKKRKSTKNSKPTTERRSSISEDDGPCFAGKRLLRTYKKPLNNDLLVEKPTKRKEKRDLKRRDMKSKFKRLGMLPVANFEDKN